MLLVAACHRPGASEKRAHRMRTVARTDHIVVLENGRVAEQGTPAELMERGGLYRRMMELQSESSRWRLNS